MTSTFPVSTGLHLEILLSSCGPFGIVPDGVCNLVGGAADAISQAGEVLQNPFRWLYHHTLGSPLPQHAGDPGWNACQADWLQDSCPKLIDQLQPSNLTLADTWPRLYSGFAVSGVFIAMTCCVIRLARGMFDHRADALQLVADNIMRTVIVAGLLVAPTPGQSLLLNAMRLSASASGRIAEAAARTVASAFATNGGLGRVVGRIAAVGFGLAGVGDFLVAIPILLVAIAFVYVLALYLLRIVQLVFAVASAPLFVALAVYDHRNRFVQWWMDLFTSAMLLPIILAICGSLTAGIAMFFLGADQGALSTTGAAEGLTRTLLACLGVLGGIWMTGKAVHGLAWRSFSHGGITGAATALSTGVMALPNAAGDVSALMRIGGLRPRPGGFLETLSSPARHGVSTGDQPRPGSDTGAVVAAAAAGHAAAMTGASPEIDAAIDAAAIADFSHHAAVVGLLEDPAAQHAFNRAVGAAVGRFASGAEGRRAVLDATRHNELGGTPPPGRVAEYTSLIARDPDVGDAVAGAMFAGLLHNQPPDLTPILRSRTQLR